MYGTNITRKWHRYELRTGSVAITRNARAVEWLHVSDDTAHIGVVCVGATGASEVEHHSGELHVDDLRECIKQSLQINMFCVISTNHLRAHGHLERLLLLSGRVVL